MNSIFKLLKQLSAKQLFLSITISLYIAGALNSAIFMRAYQIGGIQDGMQLSLSFVVMVLFSLFLLELASLGGRFLYRTIGSILIMVSSAASYYMIFFNVVIGYGVIASVFKVTDIEFASESVGYKFILWVLFTGLIPALLFLSTTITESFWQQIKSKSRGLVTITVLITCFFIVKTSVETIDERGFSKSKAQNRYTAVPSGIMTSSFLPTNWISGMLMYSYQEMGENNKQLINPAERFDYQEAQPMDDTYVVFVLGETTRGDHMQLLGYERETNPLMAKEKNLVVLDGTSCDTATLLSMRCMFVREGAADESNQREVSEHNIFYVLSELGFSSELYSMQSEVWFYNTIGADSFEMRETLAANLDPNIKHFDDMVLLDYMDKSIERHPSGKHLVILHTKGSHYLYSQRYPKEFAHFKPECINIDKGCSKEQLINSFDNSIRYVDLFMTRVFDELRDKKAIVFYASDHGESVDANSHFHATPKEIAPPEQFSVPLMVWASDKFLEDQTRSEGFENLKKLNGKPAIHEQIFDSMLGCLGYNSPDGGINQDNNWCAER